MPTQRTALRESERLGSTDDPTVRRCCLPASILFVRATRTGPTLTATCRINTQRGKVGRDSRRPVRDQLLSGHLEGTSRSGFSGFLGEGCKLGEHALAPPVQFHENVVALSCVVNFFLNIWSWMSYRCDRSGVSHSTVLEHPQSPLLVLQCSRSYHGHEARFVITPPSGSMIIHRQRGNRPIVCASSDHAFSKFSLPV